SQPSESPRRVVPDPKHRRHIPYHRRPHRPPTMHRATRPGAKDTVGEARPRPAQATAPVRRCRQADWRNSPNVVPTLAGHPSKTPAFRRISVPDCGSWASWPVAPGPALRRPVEEAFIAIDLFTVQQRQQDFGAMDLADRDLKEIAVEDDQVGRFADLDGTGF